MVGELVESHSIYSQSCSKHHRLSPLICSASGVCKAVGLPQWMTTIEITHDDIFDVVKEMSSSGHHTTVVCVR